MAKLRVFGKKELTGRVNISGAKNAALKIIPAAILAKTSSKINNIPNITDIRKMEEILQSIGTEIQLNKTSAIINPQQTNSFCPDRHLMKKLRGSVVLVGPLLSRFGQAVFSQPGGCLIGARPVDDHLDVFHQMGVRIQKRGEEYILKGFPRPGTVVLGKMSVTATENAIMAAVFSKGRTKIEVAAAEPEVTDLAAYLNKMGAKINGAGTHSILVEGVRELRGTDYTIIPDRIEAATYLITAIALNSIIEIGPIIPDHLSIVLKKLSETGARFEVIARGNQHFIKTLKHGKLSGVDIDTRTYPGFPTDLQSPFTVLMTQAQGQSRIFETLFEGRFLYLSELEKMGAKIEVLSPHIINVTGSQKLKPRRICCQDIRGGAALIIAALLTEGETIIDQIEYVDRGYDSFDQKLIGLGAKIERNG